MKQCSVPNCNKKATMGWHPILHMKESRMICKHHWEKHCNKKDPFNFWDAFKIRKPETTIKKGETKMAKVKAKKKVKVKAKTKKTSGNGILATWANLFAANEKKHLSDKQILLEMKKRFPKQSAKSKIFNSVSAHRSFYNRGILTGSKPKVRSKQFGA